LSAALISAWAEEIQYILKENKERQRTKKEKEEDQGTKQFSHRPFKQYFYPDTASSCGKHKIHLLAFATKLF
jgi:hypothetical protein